MKYILSVDDVFEFDGNDYITMDRTVYNDDIYYFTNKLLVGDEPSKDFITFKQEGVEILIETDKKILNEVLKHFSETVNMMLEKIAIEVRNNE